MALPQQPKRTTGIHEPASPAPSAWSRLSPLADRGDPVLEAVEEHLARSRVRESLRRCERTRTYPREVMEALREKGVASLFTEESRATAFNLCSLNAVTARASGSLAISVGIQGLALLPVYIAGTRAQRERAFAAVAGGDGAAILLTEWDHGSDVARIETRAEPYDGGFRLRGEKHLINGGSEARILVTLVRTSDPASGGGPFAPSNDLSVFLVERDETVEALTPYRTLTTPAADISGVRFHDTRVGRDALVGEMGEGFSVIQRTLTLSRGGIASFASGTTAATWDLSWDFARRRRIYGAPILELGAIRDHLLRIALLDSLTSALAVKAATAINALGQASGYFTAAAKLACCSLAEAAVSEGRRLHGARALLDDLPYARLVRDVLLFGVFDGTSHVMLGQLQGYLGQMIRDAEMAPDEALTWTAELYQSEPRSLLSMPHRRRRAEVPHIGARVRALDELPGEVSVSCLIEIADAAYGLLGELEAGGRWARDQGAAFALAGLVARFEALLALLELGDESRRRGLGLPPLARPLRFGDDLLRYAIASEGRACILGLRRLAGPGDRTGLEEVEESLLAQLEATRTVLHDRLEEEADPDGDHG